MGGLIAQEFKTLIKSPASISILVIPLVLLVGLGYLLPSGWIVPSSITIGIVAAVLLYFGGSIEEIKRTSFMKSISLTRLSKLSFLATKILFAMVVSMISVMWVLFFSWVFTSTSIAFLATDFSNLLVNTNGPSQVIANLPFEIEWSNVDWLMMIYAGIITIVVAVSLSFVFVAFAKSSLSFYLMSFGYLLAMILFGGVVMPGFLISEENEWFKTLYYFVPNYYTNNVMANSFSDGALAQIVGTIEGGVSGFVNKVYALLYVIDDGSLVEGLLSGTSFGEILSLSIDPNILATATQTDIDNVTALFESGSPGIISDKWDGSMYDLSVWYEAVVAKGENTLFIDEVYALLSLPSQYEFDSWLDYFKDQVPLFVVEGKPGMQATLNTVANTIINNFVFTGMIEGDGLTQFSEFISNLVTAVNLDALLGLAGVQVSLPISIDTLIAVEPLLPFVGQIIESVLLNVIEGFAPDLAASIQSMYAPTDTYNLYVPWIEGAIFLAISITFFKWS